jgi:hypothetical protein
VTHTPPPPGDVDEEIEIFRKDEESAQQTFFAYIGIRDLIARRPDVHAAINRNAMFWLTTHRALFVSTFVGLGRIFDQDSAHNLDRLLSIVGRNIPELGRDALRQRKEQVISAEQAAEYVKEKHETTRPMSGPSARRWTNGARSMRRSTARSFRSIPCVAFAGMLSSNVSAGGSFPTNIASIGRTCLSASASNFRWPANGSMPVCSKANNLSPIVQVSSMGTT